MNTTAEQQGIERWLDLGLLTRHWFPTRLLPLLAALLVLTANVLVFAVVPDERVMGAVQRIFYFHVGAAMGAYLMIGVLFVASVCYLNSRKVQWDVLGEASGAVALMLSSVVLATGMIWGNSAWNTWWRWEPRLVSFLVLWLILLSYVLLRSFSEHHGRQRNFAAVLGILAAVMVPLVIYSVKLLDQSQQLHPEVVAKQGLRDSRFTIALIVSIIAMLVFSFWLLLLKAGNLLAALRLTALRHEAHDLLER